MTVLISICTVLSHTQPTLQDTSCLLIPQLSWYSVCWSVKGWSGWVDLGDLLHAEVVYPFSKQLRIPVQTGPKLKQLCGSLTSQAAIFQFHTMPVSAFRLSAWPLIKCRQFSHTLTGSTGSTQMTHNGQCDMLICMSRSRNVNTRAKPECWHFYFGTYIHIYISMLHTAIMLNLFCCITNKNVLFRHPKFWRTCS